MVISPRILVYFISFSWLGVLLCSFPWDNWQTGIDLEVVGPALQFTLVQATVSAACATFLGLLAAPGFGGRPWTRFLRMAFLFPNVLSVVILVLCLLVTFDEYPFGFWGVVLGHVFLNTGLAAIWLGDRWTEIEKTWFPVAQSLSSGRLYFYKKIVLPLLWPDVKSIFAVIFSLCLTSFAIPLVLGGGPAASTIEVLIYERIRVGADVVGATGLALLQCLIQFLVFVFILGTNSSFRNDVRFFKGPKNSFALITILLAISILWPVGQLVVQSVSHLGDLLLLFNDNGYILALKTSVTVALITAVALFLMLAVLTAQGFGDQFQRMPALSGVVVGLGCLLIFGNGVLESRLILIISLVLGSIGVFAFPLIRIVAPGMLGLRREYHGPISLMGGGFCYSLRKVYLPLGLPLFFSAAALAFCWSLGEFSIAAQVAPGEQTVPLYIHGLMSRYRLEEAMVASLVLLAASALGVLFFDSMTRLKSWRTDG